MKLFQVTVASLATLSLASAVELHRVRLQRVDVAANEGISDQARRAISRYAVLDNRPSLLIQIKNKVIHDTPKQNSQDPADQGQQLEKGLEGGDESDETKATESVAQEKVDDEPDARLHEVDARRAPPEGVQGTAFVGEVALGTPAQYLTLDFSLGSSDTWVLHPNATCNKLLNTQCDGNHRKAFRPAKSTTFLEEPNTEFSIAYGVNTAVSGQLHTDSFEIANFALDNQVFGLATDLGDLSMRDRVQGVFGLGPNALAPKDKTASPLAEMVDSGMMRSEIGFWLARGGEEGEVVFGGMDPDRVEGVEDVWVYDVTADSQYWATPVRAISLDGRKDEGPVRFESRKSQGGANVIFDTTTDLLLLPPGLAQKVHQSIHNSFFGWYSGYNYLAKAYTVPCNLEDHADLLVEFGTHEEEEKKEELAKQDEEGKGAQVEPPMQEEGKEHQVEPTKEEEVDGSQVETTKEGNLEEQRTAPTEQKDQVPLIARRQDVSASAVAGEEEGVLETAQDAARTPPSPLSPRPALHRIAKRDIVRKPVPFVGRWLNMCYSGIQATKSDNDDWIFGSVWNYNNYMVLDHARRKMVFLPAVQSD